MSAGYRFFLTPEEDERIRGTVRDRLRKCRETAGQPRVATDYHTLRSQAMQESLFADMETSAGEGTKKEAMPALAVGSPYPPCTVSASALKPMKISELCMDTHHRGRVLHVRREAPVVIQKARSWTVVQDIDSPDAERLELVLHKVKAGEEVLETAKRFMIKEPYLTLSEMGEQTIIVHHPSDLIICLTTASATKTAEQRKKEGNAALKENELNDAHAAYTLGLEAATANDGEIVKDLHRNRALINLRLGRYDEAKSDGIAAVTGLDDPKHKDLDVKAYYRAGLAAYSLGKWQEAKRLFEEQLKLAPADKDGIMNLRRIEQRTREEETGAYDLTRIKAALSSARPRADAASFNKHTEVKPSPGAGRGLFATRQFRPGDIIFCEKAFTAVFGHVDEAWTAMTVDTRDDYIRGFPAALHKALVQKLLNNPSQVEKLLDMYGDYDGLGKQLVANEDGPVIDTFQVHDIICRNSFSPGAQYGEEDVSNASTGIWIWTAYANHSCVPNAHREFVGDFIIARAIQPISPGDEITFYYDDSSDYDTRQTNLTRTWGFKCHCQLCAVQEAEDLDLRKKRLDLERQVGALLEKEHPSQAKKLTISRARRLAGEIEKTYDQEAYRNLPTKALEGVQQWLALAKG